MALECGTSSGSYQVAEQIGSGGMGEVWRATDTELGRQAAVKVLPQAFVDDVDRLARFRREAELLASLNHPNIATIYGLEKSGDQTIIVMELVEGPTLADRIEDRPIPFDEAMGIALQIVAALEAAHDKGIVHRDLKPANVKVREDGTVKVLDFGIAKALDMRTISGSQAPSLTTPAMTEAGIVLGTAQYMSPEQARGKLVDQRADIWAFGCVLYEMITGQPAFSGEDVTVVLARVLERAADLSALPGAVSAAVQKTIHLCLQKDPRKRIADIRDVRLALEGAFETAGLQTPPAARAGTLTGRLGWVVAAVAVLTAAALAIPAIRHLGEGPAATASGSVARVQLDLPQGTTLLAFLGQTLAVSPDGSRIAFIGTEGGLRQVFVRRMDEFEAIPLPGTDTASECCAFSPDGSSLAFVAVDGVLKRVSLADGLVTPITSGAEFTGHDWGSDDAIVFARGQELWRVASSGGEPTRLMMEEPETGARLIGWPDVLPGAQAILFASADVGSDETRIESISPASGERHTVIERGTRPLYVPGGHLLFYRDGALLAAPFDITTQRVTGASVRLLEDIPAAVDGIPRVAVSAAGTLLYAPSIGASQLVWVSRQGQEQVVTATPRLYQNPRVDPRGRWVLVQTDDLWLHDLARSTFTRVDAEPTSTAYAVLTPNGEGVVFKTLTALFWRALDGSGRGEAIAGTTVNDFPATVSADGERLLFVRLSPDTSGDIFEASLSGDENVRPILQTAAYEGSAKLSPNGEWLAYASDDSGQLEVYLRPFSGPDRRWQVSTVGGTQPMWNPNGQEIFYRDGDRMMAVSVLFEAEEPELGDPELLFEQPYAYGTGITIPNYDVSADGERFLMVKDDASVDQLNLVLNWTTELESFAPTE